MPGTWTASPSPGNKRRGRWGSASAKAEGAYNIAGVASPAIDAMIAALLAAKSREDFVAAVRALDRHFDLGLLYRASLLCSRNVDRLFEQARTSRRHASFRRRSRRMVEARQVSPHRRPQGCAFRRPHPGLAPVWPPAGLAPLRTKAPFATWDPLGRPAPSTCSSSAAGRSGDTCEGGPSQEKMRQSRRKPEQRRGKPKSKEKSSEYCCFPNT